MAKDYSFLHGGEGGLPAADAMYNDALLVLEKAEGRPPSISIVSTLAERSTVGRRCRNEATRTRRW